MKVFEKEHNKSWADSYIPVCKSVVPQNVKIVGSQVIQKIKQDPKDEKLSKPRIFSHENENFIKGNILKI